MFCVVLFIKAEQKTNYLVRHDGYRFFKYIELVKTQSMGWCISETSDLSQIYTIAKRMAHECIVIE